MAEWLPALIMSIITFIGGWVTSKARAAVDNAQANAINIESFQKLIKDVRDLSDASIESKKNVARLEDELRDVKQAAERDREQMEKERRAYVKEISDLKDRIEADVRETERLRGKIVDLEERHARIKRINDILLETAHKNGWELPREVEDDLTDTMKRKWKRLDR